MKQRNEEKKTLNYVKTKRIKKKLIKQVIKKIKKINKKWTNRLLKLKQENQKQTSCIECAFDWCK